MRRLSLQIYLTFVAVLVLFALLWWLVMASGRADDRLDPWVDDVAAVAELLLPPADADPAAAQTRLRALAQRLRVDLALHAPDGRRIASQGDVPPLPARRTKRLLPLHARGAFALELPDGRWLVARHHGGATAWRGAVMLGALVLAMALGSYPLVRRLTRRLERLRESVDALGAGDLSARVEVEGRDEIAALARSLNRSAERIEELVSAQRNTLAAASHELRSPLARMRVALELIGEDVRPELRARIARDITELDEGIGELLLASRLEAAPGLEQRETVDLVPLLLEEAERTGARVLAPADGASSGGAVPVEGDPRLLRRLLRNLLENARRHAAGSPVTVRIEALPEAQRVRVEDRGPGVPEALRERIFEPYFRLPGMRERGDGVGLGLALVRRIAALHGGTVRCLAREGGGSTFELRLPPAAAARAGPPAQKQAPRRTPAG